MNINVEQVRRWVRGTLSVDERREVGRWMMRSLDPALPNIVQGLIREHEEEVADAAMRTRAPKRGFVLDWWQQLLDIGRGTFETLRPPQIAGGAVLGGASTGTGLVFRHVDDHVVVDVVLAGPEQLVAVLATTDLADEHLLFPPTLLVSGTYPEVARWTPEARDGRVTFWLALAGPACEPAAVRELATLRELALTGLAEVFAARWTDP